MATSRFFSHAFLHKRCLIPADGWFECMNTEQGKQPYYITDPTRDDREVLFFAGIYSGSVETGFSVAILTEPAAPNLQHIHSRQPVVLDPGCRYEWLDSDPTERGGIKHVTRRFNPDQLSNRPVTPAMNRPDYDDASITQPIK